MPILSLTERFLRLEEDLQATPPAFTTNSDLPFAIFRYDPTLPDESEWEVRGQIQSLATRLGQKTGKGVHLLSLALLYWKAIEDSEGIETLFQGEREFGFEEAEEQVHTYLSEPMWKPLPDLLETELAAYEPMRDLVFLTRAGVFAPHSYRVSMLLEQLMGRILVPTVLFYPGVWTGSLNYLGLHHQDEPMGSYRIKIYGGE